MLPGGKMRFPRRFLRHQELFQRRHIGAVEFRLERRQPAFVQFDH